MRSPEAGGRRPERRSISRRAQAKLQGEKQTQYRAGARRAAVAHSGYLPYKPGISMS